MALLIMEHVRLILKSGDTVAEVDRIRTAGIRGLQDTRHDGHT